MNIMLKLVIGFTEQKIKSSWRSARIIFRACLKHKPLRFFIKHRRIGMHKRPLKIGNKNKRVFFQGSTYCIFIWKLKTCMTLPHLQSQMYNVETIFNV